MNINWTLLGFSELNAAQLYELLQLRMEVFVVEQNCPYQDADGKDVSAFHLLGYSEENRLIACARILPAGLSFAEASIGRVCTSSLARKTGAGKELMKQAIAWILQTYGPVPIRIGAQSYLLRFYSGLGFEVVSSEYLEDGIPHLEMLLLTRHNDL